MSVSAPFILRPIATSLLAFATVLGGAQGNMIGQLVASQFGTAQNWALGSAMAVLLILVIMLTIAVAAGILWLISLPFRNRSRLVLGEAS